MNRINTLLLALLLPACADAPLPVSLVATDVETCRTAEDALEIAVDAYAAVGVRVDYTGCHVRPALPSTVSVYEVDDDVWVVDPPLPRRMDGGMRVYVLDRVFAPNDSEYGGFAIRYGCEAVAGVSMPTPEVMAHEIGHHLRVGKHSDVVGNIMYPTADGAGLGITDRQADNAAYTAQMLESECL